MKPANRADITDLEDIPNIGPSIAGNLRLIGVHSPKDLAGNDPYTMYDDLCDATGVRHDPCIDVFIAAVRLAGEPSKPWWKYISGISCPSHGNNPKRPDGTTVFKGQEGRPILEHPCLFRLRSPFPRNG